MPAFSIDQYDAMREVAEVENALFDGHRPPGLAIIGSHNHRGAIAVAAFRLGIEQQSLRRRVGTPGLPGASFRKLGLSVDWSMFREPPSQHTEQNDPQKPEPEQQQPPADPVDLRRIKDENASLRAALADTERRAALAEDIRAGVLGLINPPLRPAYDRPAKEAKAGSRTVILHLSDWHCGEVVDLDQMAGLNAFNLDIFRARVSRLTSAAVDLLTVHWNGKPPEKIIVIVGGDMVTGEIHEELAKTNDALSAPAVRECAERLAGLLKELRKIAPLDIYNIPGNHARLTRKPESKGFAANSLDTLIVQIVEMMMLSDAKGIRFFYPQSGDAILTVYGRTFVVAHGDRIGAKGGQGFLGAFATIIRGMHKVHAYYAAQGIAVDYVMTAHLHSTGYIPTLGIANGSLIGPSEYSRDLRAKPEAAKQNLIVVHSEKGIIDFQELKCGAVNEGSIYRPRIAA